ncbi:NACHT domain-containing protein [Streptomyces sp. NPDC002888]|uniref:NACHT domain-containing protein n=1 Tax=Streptomyces sp. NPDC002888 TaxID=3364668 RepID=UPI0036C88A1E
MQRRVGLGVAAAALVALAGAMASRGTRADEASMWTSAISAFLSVCAFVADLLREPADNRRSTDRRQRAADELAEAVQVQWAAEARLRRLQDPEPLNVHWSRIGPPIADHGQNVRRGLALPEPRDGDQRLDRIVETFRELPSGRLVVLGDPGAGKTILAVQFVLGTLAARQQGGPVPVLFALASWDPRSAGLREWLAERLAAEYRPLAAARGERTLARELLDAGLVLPVLDGFDELPEPVHRDALRHLNAELDDGLPVLLTSRTADWTRAVHSGDVLTSAEVVELRPLDFAAARAYLESTARSRGDGSTAWTPVLQDPPAPLAEVLKSPLTVALARTVYGDLSRDPAELRDTQRFPAAERIEAHLLDAFVPAAFAGVHGTWRPEAAHHWLRRLARDVGRHDRERGTWRLAWWELSESMPRAMRAIGPAVLAMLAAVWLVPLARYGDGAAGDWAASPPSMVVHLTGILLGLCFGLAFLLPAGSGPVRGPGQLGRMAVKLTAAVTVVGTAFGLLVPPVVGLRFSDVITPRPAWFLNGCFFGLIVSMLFAVAGLPRCPLPQGLPWSGSRNRCGAFRVLGIVIALSGLLTLAAGRHVLPALSCLVAGLMLCLGAQRYGNRVTAPYAGPLVVLRGFGSGLLRGLLVCQAIGVLASVVFGGAMGAFAAYEVRSVSAPANVGLTDDWHARVSADGVRTVTSTKPYPFVLLHGSDRAAPLAVPRDAEIAYKGRVPEDVRKRVRIRMDSGGPVLTAAGVSTADAWNVVIMLPRPVQLWLVQRPTSVVIRDAVVPLAAFGVLIGAIGGCASGVHRALSTPSDMMRASGPQSTLRTDRAAALARSALAAVLAGGVCMALMWAVPSGSLLNTMPTELWVPVGTSTVALSAWGRLGSARVWLAVTGRAPWRLMRFLAEAHRRGVLRQSGAHYEFRHLRLQQRLAAAADADGTRARHEPSPIPNRRRPAPGSPTAPARRRPRGSGSGTRRRP